MTWALVRRSVIMQRLLLGIVLGVSVTSLSACDSKKEAPPPPTKDAPAPADKAKEATSLKSEGLPEKDVRALVDEWARAQNAGEFEAYSNVFAERFEGIKRAGKKKRSYDRKGWLQDRAKMFEKDFTVKVDDLQIATSPASAIVRFTQTWTSATFQDKGPKQLLIVKEKDELRIAREEMLRSTLGADSEKVETPDVRDFAFVWGSLLMIEEMTDLSAATGHPEYGSHTVVTRPLNVDLLPAEKKSLVGEEFALYGPEGKLCTTKVETILIHAELQPHFGQEQAWAGQNGFTKATNEQIALDLWRLSDMGGRFLAGRLEKKKECEGAIWARSVKRPEVAAWKARKPSQAETKEILKVTRTHAEYRAEQAAYASYTGKNEPWEQGRDGKTLLTIFEGPQGAAFVDVSLENESGGCGAGFEGVFWTMLKRKGDSFVIIGANYDEQVESHWPRMLDSPRTQSAFDLNGDGVPEFAGGFDFFQSVGGKVRATYNLSPAYFDCPC